MMINIKCSTCEEEKFSKWNLEFGKNLDRHGNRPFSKLTKLSNWQLADCNRHINYDHRGPETDFFMGV